MINEQIEKAPLPKRSARNGIIEVLQVVSLIMLGVAWLFPATWIPAVCIALALFVVPFLLVQPPGRESYRIWARGYKITPERRQKLAEVGVPAAILRGIDPVMIGVYYRWRRYFVKALHQNLSQEDVKPWLNTILRHAKHYDEPEATTASDAGWSNAVASPSLVDPSLHFREPNSQEGSR